MHPREFAAYCNPAPGRFGPTRRWGVFPASGWWPAPGLEISDYYL